ncbi:MAG: 2-aminoethylphosphonate--pyruvate transaminase [Maledivibacter sp.]|jgi:2-aminoethylphosphonate-pyruvate transaminase|nr:2-aminoethylphosphonate--pyruvate transaminase [Maledivibacter sp.]
MYKVKRNVLLNPGPATTTDTVKFAQVIPDICPREKEFAQIMLDMRKELVKIVHGDLQKYTSVLFCGSGTINIDACVNSLLPPNKKMLVINNGSYSARAAEVCEYYNLPHINLKFSLTELPDLEKIEKVLKEDGDIAVVYACHHETGTGLLNPIREIGKLAHDYGSIFMVDTTSTYAMIPIDIEKDNIDFLMASAQKGLMSMTGLSYVVGNRELIERSKEYPTRSYYTNLYMQYDFFERKGQMHFTPPVQTVYATKQAIKEYWEEGEAAKWARHQRIWEAQHEGLTKLGFKDLIERDKQSRLVISVKYPDDPNWSFEGVHDYCFERGFTIYPGKVTDTATFRLCSLGAIDVPDIEQFFVVLEQALIAIDVKVPIEYNSKETD